MSSPASAYGLSEREAAVVACIASRSHGTRKAVGVSRRQLMEATGLTADQTRRACRSLDRRGLLDVCERFRENGGCAENAYSLTEQAVALLSSGALGEDVFKATS